MKFLFKTDIRIQVSDINYGGHLGNDRFLVLAQEARARFFQSFGWTEKNIAGTHLGIVVAEAHIKFIQEVFFGQIIEVELFLEDRSKCSFELCYHLIEKFSRKKVSDIWTKIAFFDYEKRKISSCPPFFEAIESHLKDSS